MFLCADIAAEKLNSNTDLLLIYEAITCPAASILWRRDYNRLINIQQLLLKAHEILAG